MTLQLLLLVDGSVKPILEFRFPILRIGRGTFKDQAVLMNNVNRWKRGYQTILKKEFKDSLRDWVIPVSDLGFDTGRVEFKLFRNNGIRQDADSIAYQAKWLQDLLVEQGWFSDDRGLTTVFEPVTIEKDRVEHEIRVRVYD